MRRQREKNKGVSPEEKERRRRRDERAEKAREARRRRRYRNPLGTLERIPKGARMWEDVYESALDRGYSEERSAMQAWGAVKRAGYHQDRAGTWRAPNASPEDPDYHRRNVVLEEKLALSAMEWHGGQGSMLYSLASTAYAGHLVSPSMIDAAIGELKQAQSWDNVKEDRALATELQDLIGELDGVARFSDEFTYEGEDDGYATWLMDKEANPAPKQISGPLRIQRQADGLWVVGQGVAVPVESSHEARELIDRLRRRPNSPGATVLSFDSVQDVGSALETMDLALRPSRMERPTVFRIDWGSHAIVLEGDPDEPGVSQAITALERGDHHFDVDVVPAVAAANPKGGTRGKAAGYAFLGQWIGGVLGFGLGALVGGLAGLAASGAPGAVVGALIAGAAGGYGGGIWGAWEGAQRGAPPGLERAGSTAAAMGAAVPYVNLFMAPLAAYLATAP